MKVVFQTEDGQIFDNRDDAANHEAKLKGQEKKLEVWILNMPGMPCDGTQVVKKIEYDKLNNKLKKYEKT